MSITAADITFSLAIAGVFTTPQILQGFAMDGLFDMESVDAAEVQVGADATGTAGWLPQSPTQTIKFLADSTSVSIFDIWNTTQSSNGNGLGGPGILYASGQIIYPALGMSYTLFRGTLKRFQPLASAGKTLKEREFGIQWLPNSGQPAVFPSPI